jgi:hypothetical protein
VNATSLTSIETTSGPLVTGVQLAPAVKAAMGLEDGFKQIAHV